MAKVARTRSPGKRASARHFFVCLDPSRGQLCGFLFHTEGIYQISANRFLAARLRAQVCAPRIHCQQTDSTASYIKIYGEGLHNFNYPIDR